MSLHRRLLLVLGEVMRVVRNFTKSLVLPLTMNVKMSKKTHAREYMSDISGEVSGASFDGSNSSKDDCGSMRISVVGESGISIALDIEP